VPRADEILVVDSSDDGAVEEVVSRFHAIGTRRLACREIGLGNAFNLGLRAARHDVVLLTNDDCVVDERWVEVGLRRLSAVSRTIVTGRVRPLGDPETVPSTIDDAARRDHTTPGFYLYTQSMALRRPEVLELGGFDGRIAPSAEDNDLSYRWLNDGGTIRYEPDFVVWHRDWRTPEQLERLYVAYGIGQGMVYAKHLRGGDLAIGRFVLRDAYAACRGLVDRVVRGRRPHGDWRLGLAQGLPIGLLRGWRACRSAQPGGSGR